MSQTEAEGFGRWIDLIGGLLAEPLTTLPHKILIHELIETLGAGAGAWVQQSRIGPPMVEFRPLPVMPTEEAINWMQPHLVDHPLVRWFVASGAPAAQTLGRVPLSVSGPHSAAWRHMTAHLCIEEQLSMPLTLNGSEYRAFVLMRHGDDFPDEVLRLARRIQPLLVGVERQAQALARWTRGVDADHEAVRDVGLTGRQLAVLTLIADGLTAIAAAHRLAISPRTVEKHLESTYAKLRCNDRVTAVLRAQALGILPRSARSQSNA